MRYRGWILVIYHLINTLVNLPIRARTLVPHTMDTIFTVSEIIFLYNTDFAPLNKRFTGPPQ